MKLNQTTLAVLAVGAFSSCTNAAGLSMSQLATTKSVATAGAGNVTNTLDSSATVSNPAALSQIKQSSYQIGGQYINVFSTFTREDNGATTESSKGLIAPHLSYAKRMDENTVLGASLHSAGGLGVDYSNGVSADPINLISENAISIVNLTAAMSYQLSDKLSIGGSAILQHASIDVVGGINSSSDKLASGTSIAPTFAVSAFYLMSDQTSIGAQYNHSSDHEFEVSSSTGLDPTIELSWVRSFDVGIHHSLSQSTAILLNAKIENWHDYNAEYDMTYSLGLGLQKKLDRWTVYTGASIDSSPVSKEKRDVLLPVDKQWRIGVGAEYLLDSGRQLGLAYQYQNNGEAEINAGNGIIQPTGDYTDNRIHFLTMSYRY